MATEGNLQAPTRHPIDWKNPDYYNEAATFHEMERIFVIEPRLLPFQRFPLRRLQAALGQNLICRDSHAWAVQALLAE